MLAKAGVVLVCTTSLLALMARWSPILDFATSFPVHCLGVALVSGTIFAWKRSARWTALAGTMALIQLSMIIPWYVRSGPVASDARDFRVMEANVHYLNRQYARFIEMVRSEGPDFVMIEELTPAWFEGIKPLLNDYPYFVAEPKAGVLRIGLFSKCPLENTRLFWIVPETYGSIWAETRIAGRKVTILAVHAIPAWQIGWPPFRSEWGVRRNATFDRIPGLLGSVDGPCLLLGDHNATMWSPCYRKMMRDAGLRNARKGFGILPTWSTYFQPLMIPIDQCLYRGPLAAADCRTGRRFGSDHLPLIVDFRFQEPASKG